MYTRYTRIVAKPNTFAPTYSVDHPPHYVFHVASCISCDNRALTLAHTHTQTNLPTKNERRSIGPDKLNRIFSISVEIPAPFIGLVCNVLAHHEYGEHENSGEINVDRFTAIRNRFSFSIARLSFNLIQSSKEFLAARKHLHSSIFVAYCAMSSLHRSPVLWMQSPHSAHQMLSNAI